MRKVATRESLHIINGRLFRAAEIDLPIHTPGFYLIWLTLKLQSGLFNPYHRRF